MNTFDALFNLYHKGSLDIDVILDLLNMDLPEFADVRRFSKHLGDALTKVSAELTESRQENELLQGKLEACRTAARCKTTEMPVAVGIAEWSEAHLAIGDLHKAYRRHRSDYLRFMDTAQDLRYWRSVKENGILNHGENPTFTIKPGPLTDAHLKWVFDMLKDQGEPPRMVVTNLVDLYGFKETGVGLDFEPELTSAGRDFGHLGTIGGVPVYYFYEAAPPQGELFVLADRNNPKGMNLPSVRGFVKVLISESDEHSARPT